MIFSVAYQHYYMGRVTSPCDFRSPRRTIPFFARRLTTDSTCDPTEPTCVPHVYAAVKNEDFSAPQSNQLSLRQMAVLHIMT